MMETQQTIGDWCDITFPGVDPESPRMAIRALEEVAELCLASGATTEQIINAATWATLNSTRVYDKDGRLIDRNPADVPKETADVLIVLYRIAHMWKFDLHTEVEKKMVVNRKRKWRARGDGTGYHVKE